MEKWTTKGKVKDLETGNVYELSGCSYDELSRTMSGNGLVLLETLDHHGRPKVAIERVETIFTPTGLIKTSCYLAAILKGKYEVIE